MLAVNSPRLNWGVLPEMACGRFGGLGPVELGLLELGLVGLGFGGSGLGSNDGWGYNHSDEG
jgi:hypothetical protein